MDTGVRNVTSKMIACSFETLSSRLYGQLILKSETICFNITVLNVWMNCEHVQGRSQTKCDGGASQLQFAWPIINLYAIRQYSQIKLITLYF